MSHRVHIMAFIALLGAALSGIASAQVPTVTQGSPPGTESFLGEPYCFTTTFTNTGNPGFGPYVRVIVPNTLTGLTATIFGQSSATLIGSNPPATSTGDPLFLPAIAPGNVVTIPADSSYYNVVLPLGSVVAGGPPIDIRICATIDPSAVVGMPLPILTQPMYRFGDTATGANGSIAGSAPLQSVTPTIVRFTKVDTAPESERPPGPAWPFDYVLSVDIANTANLDNLVITDTLPPNVQFVGPITVAGATCTSTPPPGPGPGGSLSVSCATDTGVIGGGDLVVSFPVFVADVLDEATCATQNQINNATLAADYDPPVGATTSIAPINVTDEVSVEHVVAQKGAAPANVAPGDTVNYTVSVQTTQFGTVDALTLIDTLPDGIDFVAGSATVDVGGGPVAITPTVVANASGTLTATFAVVPAVAATLPPTSTVTLSYQGTVRQIYRGTALTGPVNTRDTLDNSVTMEYSLVTSALACSNGSAASVTVQDVAAQKSLQAITRGGVPQLITNPAQPGDVVTYRVSLTIPSGDARSIRLQDFFPLPVFEVANQSVGATVLPPPGIPGSGGLTVGGVTIRRGPGDNLCAALGVGNSNPACNPTSLVASAATNSIQINYPDLDTDGDPDVIFELDLDVTVSDDPVADALLLTNLLETSTSNTQGTASTSETPVQIQVRAPAMRINKGVIATSGNGTISSMTQPPDGNLTGADAGDTVTFQLTAENIGGAPAYQVRLRDALPPTGYSGCVVDSVTDGTNAALANTGDLFTTGLTLTNPLTANDGNPPGGGSPFGTDTAIVRVTCTLTSAVTPGQALENRGFLHFASSPTAPTFPEVNDPASVTISTLTNTSKTYVTSSETHTSDTPAPPRVAVGEIVRYRLATQVPEGTSAALNLRDAIPNGLTFLNDNTARVAFVSNGSGLTSSTLSGAGLVVSGNSATLGALPSTSITFALPDAAVTANNNCATNTDVYASGTDVTFCFGNLVNNDSDVDAEFVVVEFNALVDNSVSGSNDLGDNRNNTAQGRLGTTNSGAASNSVQVRVAEPLITDLNKVATPSTGDAGDVISYSVTFSNPAGNDGATAFELRLLDVLPADLILNLPSVNVSGAGVGVVNNSLGNTVDIAIASLPRGGGVTVTYTANIATGAGAGTTLNNTANLTWTSLPGPNGTTSNPTGSSTPGTPGSDTGERTGSGTDPNDHFDSDGAGVTVTGVGLSKSVLSTSEPASGDTRVRAGVTDLAIGEFVTFRIVATVPEGNSGNVTIRDSLPQFLRAVSGSLVSASGNLTIANNPPTVTLSDINPGDAINDTIDFGFGAISNPPAAGVETVEVEVVAQVVNLPANVNGDQLTNTASVNYGAGLSGTATADLDLVEPQLSVVKTGSISSGDAGDTVTFTVNIAHTGASNADAFDALLSDTLPPELVFVAGSASCTGTAGAPTSINFTSPTLSIAYDEINLGESATCTYDATLAQSVEPGQTVTNTASLGWDSLAGTDPEQRNYSTSESHAITVSAPGVDKTIVATSIANTGNGADSDPDLTIGETVTYRFTVTIPDGTVNSASVFDQLPTGSSVFEVQSFSFVAAASEAGITCNGGACSAIVGVASDGADSDSFNDRVDWNLGTVVNPNGGSNVLVFEVVALLRDNPLNQGGVVDQNNTAGLSFDPPGPGGITTIQDTAAIDIVEPELDVQKSVLVPTPTGGLHLVQAGDTVTMELTLSNLAPLSSADAFNPRIRDVLPNPGLSFVALAAGGTCTSPVATPANAHDVTFTIASPLALGASCTLRYTATVDVGVNPGASYTNTATAQYDSTPTPVPGGTRTGSDADTADVTVNAPSLTKVSILSDNADTTSAVGNPALFDLAIGELVTYQLVAVLPKGTATSVVLEDVILAADQANGVLELVSGSVVSLGSCLTASGSGTPTLFDDQVVNGLNDRIAFNFGTVVNSPACVDPAGGQIIVNVLARAPAAATPTNASGDVLRNTGRLTTATTPAITDNEDIELVEPVLALDKTMGPLNAGRVRISLALQNTGNAPAYDLVVNDDFDNTVWTASGFSIISVPAGFEVVAQADTPAVGQTRLQFRTQAAAMSPNGTVPAGASVAAVIEVPLAVVPPAVNPLVNTGRMTDASSMPGDGTPDPVTDPEREYGPLTDVASLGTPTLSATKTGTPNPATAGGNITYTLVVTNNGPGDATGVTLCDTPDTNSPLVAGSVTTTQGTVSDVAACTEPVEVNLGTILANGTATVTYQVQVVSPLPAGVVSVTNQADIRSTEYPSPVPSDDPTPPGGGDPTVVPVTAAPDLVIAKSDGGVSTTPGSTVAYTLTVRNVGNQNATGVTITETVPANTTFNPGASTSGWTCVPGNSAGSTCTFVVGALAGGNTAAPPVTFAVTVDSPLPAGVTDIANSATVADDGANGPDPTPGDNTGGDTTPVVATPDLVLGKSDGGASTGPGATVVYSLSLANVGVQNATGVVITETVPANTTFNAGASAPGWACLPNGNTGSTCTLAIGNVAAGAPAIAVAFALTVDTPLPAGVTQIANTAAVADDGSNGADPTPPNNIANDTTPIGSGSPDLTLVKTDGGASTAPGAVVAYTLTYSNAGNRGATGVTISETVPANTRFNAASSSAGWSCADASPAGTTCTLAVGAVAAGGGGSVTFALSVDTPLPAGVTQIANSASITDDGNNGTDPTPGNNSSSDTTPLTGAPDLGVTKTDGNASTSPGQVVVYTLNYTNIGNRGADNVVLSETVPANTTFDAAGSTAGWSCADGAPAGTPCTLNVGTLEVGDTGSATFAIRVDATLPAGTTSVVNSLSIADDGSNGADPNPGNDTAMDSTPTASQMDLTLGKSDGNVSVAPGGIVVYTLSYANTGNIGVTGVVLSETVPANTTFDAAGSSAGWSCADGAAAGSTCTLTIGGLAAGASSAELFAVRVDTPLAAGITQVANTATVADDGANGADPTPPNNTASDTTPLAGGPDLTLTKTDGGATGSPGAVIVYTLSYANVGNRGASGVTITEIVPPNTRFVAASSAAGWSCADNATPGTSCSLSLGTLAVGASGTTTFALRIDNPLPAGVNGIVNSASIADDGSNGTDPTPTNNTATDSTPVGSQPDLRLSKSDGGIDPLPGSVYVYTLGYSNVGNIGVTGAQINETVPANSTFDAAGSSAGWSCANGSPAGTPCVLIIGNLAAGASGSATFAVRIATSLPTGTLTLVNSASIGDDGNNGADPTPSDNIDGVTSNFNGADLVIDKTGPGMAMLDDRIIYTLVVSNRGPLTAVNARVLDPTPAGLVFVSASGACAAGFPCNLGNVAANTSQTITVTYRIISSPSGGDLITNTAEVSSDTFDPTPTDNIDAATTTLSNIRQIPAGGPLATLLMALALLLAGSLALRRPY